MSTRCITVIADITVTDAFTVTDITVTNAFTVTNITVTDATVTIAAPA